ncbi:MAG: SDR family NAD(P)-dependent oxidoreductase [Phycisphaerales bacterium]|nr:SDR family NAD(P)-dependent oxidoreductase [Phycisphaerales bacterium]
MKRSLRRRVVVVTGGSSGLGLAFAQMAARDAAIVWLLARDESKLRSAAAEITEASPDASVNWVSADINDGDSLNTALGQIDKIDVMVCSAGVLKEGRFDSQPTDDWRRMIDTNVFGTVNCARAALPALKESGGQLVIVSSMAGLLGVYGYTAYSASKHALVGFSESLRFELAEDGVSVNLVCPGEFDSPMVTQLDAQRSAENRAHVLTIPKSSVESVASAIVKAIEMDRPVTIPGVRAATAAKLGAIFPALTRRVGSLTIRKAAARALKTDR